MLFPVLSDIMFVVFIRLEIVEMLEFSEKTYNRIGKAGATNIVIGILLIVGGITLGVLSIVHGGKLLSTRSDLID